MGTGGWKFCCILTSLGFVSFRGAEFDSWWREEAAFDEFLVHVNVELRKRSGVNGRVAGFELHRNVAEFPVSVRERFGGYVGDFKLISEVTGEMYSDQVGGVDHGWQFVGHFVSAFDGVFLDGNSQGLAWSKRVWVWRNFGNTVGCLGGREQSVIRRTATDAYSPDLRSDLLVGVLNYDLVRIVGLGDDPTVDGFPVVGVDLEPLGVGKYADERTDDLACLAF